MRNEPNLRIEKYRLPYPPSDYGAAWGAFRVGALKIISSGHFHEGDGGFEHVSVSRDDRCPTWDEMCLVKEMFWKDDETVVQFHPKKSEYVNFHPFCLHMWRGHKEIELPNWKLLSPLGVGRKT